METVLLSSPSSLLGQSIAMHLAQRGYNLVLLSWRSDLAEQLMHTTLQRYSVRIMIIRADLGSRADVTKIWSQMRKYKMLPQVSVIIPLIEANTIPQPLSAIEGVALIRVIRDNLTEVAEITPRSRIVYSDLDVSMLPWPRVSLLIKGVQGLLTQGEAERIAERVCDLISHKFESSRLSLWDYRHTLARLFLLQLVRMIKGDGAWR